MIAVERSDLVERFQALGWNGEIQMMVLTESNPKFHEIDWHSRLYVPADHLQSPRLAEAYREVWGAMPWSAKHRLRRYWRQRITHGYLPGTFGITIDDSAYYLAVTGYGTGVEFNGGLLGELDYLLIRDIVAHELAHAWNRTYTNSMVKQFGNTGTHQLEIEWEADITAEYWGRRLRVPFLMRRWRQWGAANPALVLKHLKHAEQWVLPALTPADLPIIHPRDRRSDDALASIP